VRSSIGGGFRCARFHTTEARRWLGWLAGPLSPQATDSLKTTFIAPQNAEN
jgi:hypothetical protein